VVVVDATSAAAAAVAPVVVAVASAVTTWALVAQELQVLDVALASIPLWQLELVNLSGSDAS